MITFTDAQGRTMESIVLARLLKASNYTWGVCQCTACPWQLLMLCEHVTDEVDNPSPCFDVHARNMIDRFTAHTCGVISTKTSSAMN